MQGCQRPGGAHQGQIATQAVRTQGHAELRGTLPRGLRHLHLAQPGAAQQNAFSGAVFFALPLQDKAGGVLLVGITPAHHLHPGGEILRGSDFHRQTKTVEQLWPQLRAFWVESGFEIAKEETEVGLMQTSWHENRAKLPQDFVRAAIGKVFDSLYSTGERDMYRTRVERVGTGTEIYISHRGMQEVYSTQQKDQTTWTGRPSDPQLEAEMLSRLMLKLGAKEEAAKAALAAAPVAGSKTVAPARSRALSEVPNSLQVNEDFERAWRRVGQSLDRHGFTVEDRDRKQGLFFLRYSDPNQAGKEEPNFFERLFTSDKGLSAMRYRVSVKSEGERSTVTVLDDKGQQQTNDIAKRILNLLMDDLR